MQPATPILLLNNNQTMPQVGFGAYKILGDTETARILGAALDAGYRLIDTASVYKNEESVGKFISSCQIPREELFITSKVWNTAQRMGDIEGAFNRSLDRLKLDYLDLYLIHWPVPGCYAQTWKALEKIYRSGRARSRGVYAEREVLTRIGQKYHKTAAQIGLRWLIQRQIAVIPKSSQSGRIRSNIDVFDFSLTEIEMKTIDTLDEHLRTASIPEDMIGQDVE